MSRWAEWIPLDAVTVAQLRRASQLEDRDEAVYRLLLPWMENIDLVPLRVSIDREWEPIHRCLTGDVDTAGLDFGAGEPPLHLCVLGGENLLPQWRRSALLIAAEEVPALATALADVRKEWFRERFFRLPGGLYHEVDEDSFERVWAHFEHLPPFFAKVAEAGLAVLCTISH